MAGTRRFPIKRSSGSTFRFLEYATVCSLCRTCLAERSQNRKEGIRAGELIIDDDSDLLKSISAIRRKGERPFAPTYPLPPTPYTVVWMSHGDRIVKQPKGFTPIAHTNNSPVAAMADKSRKFYALQFHT